MTHQTLLYRYRRAGLVEPAAIGMPKGVHPDTLKPRQFRRVANCTHECAVEVRLLSRHKGRSPDPVLRPSEMRLSLPEPQDICKIRVERNGLPSVTGFNIIYAVVHDPSFNP